jgi:hypothetical protein
MLDHDLSVYIPGKFFFRHFTPEFLKVCKAYTVPAIVNHYKSLPDSIVDAYEQECVIDPNLEQNRDLSHNLRSMKSNADELKHLDIAARAVLSSLLRKAGYATYFAMHLEMSEERDDDGNPTYWKLVFRISVDVLQRIKTVDELSSVDYDLMSMLDSTKVPNGETTGKALSKLDAIIGHSLIKIRIDAVPDIQAPFTLRSGIYKQNALVGSVEYCCGWQVHIETTPQFNGTCSHSCAAAYALYLKILDGTAPLVQAMGYLPKDAPPLST